ncbi:monofunctional biosynthetic peptidoglycan transglycosylase [Parvularcula sp. ZS-1/3]|uniref:Biosynthetic peptidoglycan transglycosylase n=1 Tax=Parvularcula mediterranea TaxID=2732508 RepID=A0A7Y3RMA8_9PROT|nr:monofunctional biosynthetic peptidoglycan transglycosylase [Parvularcula mediterranea]NNU16727.1 monofunctional biosynthetic peptidoglycan transglycosylase [Parvularcula mediterranea]
MNALKKLGLFGVLIRVLIYGVRFVLALMAVSLFFILLYRFMPVEQTTLMALRGLQGEEVRQEWVSLDDISPNLVRAVIASEDVKFCKHIGFDFGEMKAAWEDYQNGEPLRGASTISQQTAKNAFLWPGRGPVRKVVEAAYTLPMEVLYPKRRIMEIYLNVAEWGDGLFGAEAAAQERFGKSAKDLTQREAALLATVLPSPNKWRVDPPGPYVRRRSGTVRARMRSVSQNGLDTCVFKD